jgi:hypothetical protein
MKTYWNLTQCNGPRTVYFRSTDVEQKNYHRLLWSVPDEWLYLLYKSESIRVVDKSSNKGKIEHIFIPVLNDLINLMSGDWPPKAKNLKEHLRLAQDAMNRDSLLNKKFAYWCNRITQPVEIRAQTIHVEREENPITVLKEVGLDSVPKS